MGIVKKTKLFVAGTRVDCVETVDVVLAMERWICNRQLHNYVVTSNANNVVLGRSKASVKEAVNSSSLSVADGMSLVIAARLSGYPLRKRVYGPELMLSFLELAEKKGYTNFFYGSSSTNLVQLNKALRERFPLLKVVGSYSPPFRALSAQEEEQVVDLINSVRPDVVWVSLGGPKQDIWMYEHKDRIKIPVMVGVGAAFDFLAGTKPQASAWMRKAGLEWFFRLITEPKRLWRRYLINNLLFIWYVTVDLLKKRFKMCYNKDHV